MRILVLIGALIGLLFSACSHDPMVADSGLDFSDATGQPLKITVTQKSAVANPSTSILISIPESGDLTFIVYGCTGKKIRTIADGSVPAGALTLEWDGRNETGGSVKSGIYIFLIEFTGATEVIKQYQPIYIRVLTE